MGLGADLPEGSAFSQGGQGTYSGFTEPAVQPIGNYDIGDGLNKISREFGYGTPLDGTSVPLQVSDLGPLDESVAGDFDGSGSTPTVTTDNGITTTTYPDGRVDVSYSDGSRSSYDPATGTTVTISGDGGWKKTDTADGNSTMEHADGSPGWKSTYDKNTGSTEWTHTDGSHYTVDKDGAKTGVEVHADGSRTVYDHGNSTEVDAPKPPQPPQPASSDYPKVGQDAKGNTVTNYGGGVTITDLKGGGSIVDYGNGRIEAMDAAGNKSWVNGDKSSGREDAKTGNITIISPDGKSSTTTSPDGKTVTTRVQGGPTQIVERDGDKTTVTVLDGDKTTIITRTPEGSERVDMAGGQTTSTETVNYGDNTKTVERPDGSKTVFNPDGSKTNLNPDGSKAGSTPPAGGGQTAGKGSGGGSGDDETVMGRTGKEVAEAAGGEIVDRVVPVAQLSKVYDGLTMAGDIKELGEGINKSVDAARTGSTTIRGKIDVWSDPKSFNRPVSGATPSSGTLTYPEVRDAIKPTLDAAKGFVVPLQGITKP